VTAVPLTPLDCDLRDYPSMLVDVARVRDSGLASDETHETCWAAFLLWCAAWHQVPAGSIPDNDGWIAKTAGYALRGKIDKAWTKVREGALRGFVRCNDGRLYHPVVAEKALECWIDKLGRAISSGNGNAKRWGGTFDAAPIEAQIAAAKDLLRPLNSHSRALTKRKHSGHPMQSDQHPDGTPNVVPSGSQGKVREEKGREGNEYSATDVAGSAGAAPAVDNSASDPTARDESKKALWRDAKDWLIAGGCTAKDAHSYVNTLAKENPAVIEQALREAIKVRREPGDAKPYLSGIVERLAAESRKLTPTDRAERAVEATQQRLREQAAREPEPPSEAVREALAASRAKLAASAAGLAPKPAGAPASEGATA